MCYLASVGICRQFLLGHPRSRCYVALVFAVSVSLVTPAADIFRDPRLDKVHASNS